MFGPLLFGLVVLAGGTAGFLLRRRLGVIGFQMRMVVGSVERAKSPKYWEHMVVVGAIWFWSIGSVFVIGSLLSLIAR